jgi:hypothetical protein
MFIRINALRQASRIISHGPMFLLDTSVAVEKVVVPYDFGSLCESCDDHRDLRQGEKEIVRKKERKIKMNGNGLID